MSPTSVAWPAHFQAIFDRLIDREGGISDVKGDKGGFTNYGITKPFLTRFLGRAATDEDIAGLTKDIAIRAYHELIWVYEKIGDIHYIHPKVAEFMFDWCVNSGDYGIIKAQDFLGVARDGDFGPVSRAALRRALDRQGPKNFYTYLCDYRIRWCIRICVKDNSQIQFMEGWFNRVTGLRYMP